MYERSPHIIRTYLEKGDVQERIRQNIQRGRLEATVTIGRAARLFDFTENQLRDWEDRGLLKPLRTTVQRQYPPAELDKLAIIKELIEEGGFTPGSIPSDVDEIWNAIASEQQKQTLKDGAEHLPINQRIENARAELFWRYYASRALRLSLMLICEDIPNTTAGLILPLHTDTDVSPINRIEDLPQLGESLVAWLSKSRSSHTLLTSIPSFQYIADYRVLPLQVMKEDKPEEDTSKDRTLILLDRRSKLLTLSTPVVETVRRLLAPLYEEAQNSWLFFNREMRDVLEPATDLHSSANYPDIILDGLADMIVRLGGRTINDKNRWRFCCILLPEDPTLPLQQRSLIVRAQSKDSPHRVGVTTVSPDKYVNSPSLRAYQSGHIVSQPEIAKDTAIAHREVEEPVHSAIALSLGGESGEPIAVLYVVSEQEHGFPPDDRRILRMMGRIVEEVLMTYHARQQVADKLRDLINKPDVIDALFANFLSENDFNVDVEEVLRDIKKRMVESREQLTKEGAPRTDLPTQPQTDKSESGEGFLSLIAVDIDNQSILSSRYGDRVTRSLSYEVGGRIQDELRGPGQKLYHIYADRFYITLWDRTLEQVREKAQELMLTLKGPYRFDALRVSTEQQARTASMLVLTDVTVRLGVASFSYTKLEYLLQRYASGASVIEVREIITRALNQALERGKVEGGNVVISWDPQIQGFERL
jgi:DNA-binding transcriptional MerR regulator/GGDEF domain-containing protein